MKLNLSISEFASALDLDPNLFEHHSGTIQRVSFDTRNLILATDTVFFALQGSSRNGNTYIEEAIQKGVKYIVHSGFEFSKKHPEVTFFQVENALISLQKLAQYHRKKISYPVIAITGSVGKTTVKEWLFHLMHDFISIVRSPKSYNSQLGVALSLLELKPNYNLALIEAGISETGEMSMLEKMIKPTHGIFTAFGSAHRQGFVSKEEHFNEKTLLFREVEKVFIGKDITSTPFKNSIETNVQDLRLKNSPFKDEASITNLALCLAVFDYFLPNLSDSTKLIERIKDLPRLALRMETIEGINGNTIINDAYNFDIDALRHALEFQLSISNGKKRVLLMALDGISTEKQETILDELRIFSLDEIHVVNENLAFDPSQFKDSIILIKGSRKAQLEKLVSLFREKKHKTRIEINFSAVRHNLNLIRKKLKTNTKILAMIKASSYGSGAEKMAEFLERSKVEYLGVAYADEGVELRKKGIKLPILVMNAEEEGFDDIIEYNLEPSLYSFKVLDEFVKRLIYKGKNQYPVHLKFNTGMNRLGFSPNDVHTIIDTFSVQPELQLKGVYSHLADADNLQTTAFTEKQLSLFNEIKKQIEISHNTNEILFHLCNTEGALHFPSAHFDMVRIGIGLYGESSDTNLKTQLKPAISWKSVISQTQYIKAGDKIGYSGSFEAANPMKIAIIPVGYADGFKRILSNGKGHLYINNQACKVVGKICMDMTMVDVTHVDCKEGDEVEIIGTNQTLSELAVSMETIPYEVLTSMSKRVARIYIEE